MIAIARLRISLIGRRVRSSMDLLVLRFRTRHRPGLDGSQRILLLRRFKTELRRQVVAGASVRMISDQAVKRISLHRSVVRWLETGEFPGPEAIPYFERLLSEIPRNPGGSDLSWHGALVGAIHELGGDAVRAQEIWHEVDPKLAAALGRNIRRVLDEADLSIVELARRSGIPVDDVLVYAYGVEEPGARDLLGMAAALGLAEPGSLLAGLESFCLADPESDDDQAAAG